MKKIKEGWPHGTNCTGCEALGVCNYCGHALKRGERCTQARCRECHERRCTPGGNTSPGHGSGFEIDEAREAWAREKVVHK